MNKQELHVKVAKMTGHAQWEIHLILDSILETMKDHIKAGETISIKGLGTFSLKVQKPMRRNNLNTGEWFTVPEKKKLVFTPSPQIKVNKNPVLPEGEDQK